MVDLEARDEFRRELWQLVRAFRVHLSAQARAGRWAAPASPLPIPAPSPGEVEGHPAPVDGTPDAAIASGSLSGALSALLGEDTPRAAAAGSGARPDPPARPDPASPGGGGSEGVPPPGAPAERLAVVRADLGDCRRCKLAAGRQNIVFGVGDPEAALMFVGEGPGAEEDRRGEPFVGAAGQLLDRMIEAMGWRREAVYIANVVKCRPPGNRTPEADEIAACRPFLARQIEAVAPRVIVSLGRPASQLLLDTKAPISALRGRFQRYRDIPVMPTFHPAYLLRTPERKREAWSDLKHVIAELERLGVRSPRPPRT